MVGNLVEQPHHELSDTLMYFYSLHFLYLLVLPFHTFLPAIFSVYILYLTWKTT